MNLASGGISGMSAKLILTDVVLSRLRYLEGKSSFTRFSLRKAPTLLLNLAFPFSDK